LVASSSLIGAYPRPRPADRDPLTPDQKKPPREDRLHVWQARLDDKRWPSPNRLPEAERQRAAAMREGNVRNRWVAARWALRGVLAGYLGQRPASIELQVGEHGKPALADPAAWLCFNLSHSGELAMVAVATARQVGIDVQRIGARPKGYYLAWTQREAIAKCLGSGLWAPLPKAVVSVLQIEAEPGYAAALAVEGKIVPDLRRFELTPTDLETGPTAGRGRR
jgi:phosphopantetheinyl transferase